ncbi:MAG: hypothetical protein R3D25_13210 [Geminicoccaceae bacterium]
MSAKREADDPLLDAGRHGVRRPAGDGRDAELVEVDQPYAGSDRPNGR